MNDRAQAPEGGPAVAEVDQAEKDRKYARRVWERAQKLRTEGKLKYTESDAECDKLIARFGVGVPVDLGDGRVIVVVDNFAGKNVSWGHAAVRRYEVKEHKSYAAAAKPAA